MTFPASTIAEFEHTAPGIPQQECLISTGSIVGLSAA
jgi:hypothetical protein